MNDFVDAMTAVQEKINYEVILNLAIDEPQKAPPYYSILRTRLGAYNFFE